MKKSTIKAVVSSSLIASMVLGVACTSTEPEETTQATTLGDTIEATTAPEDEDLPYDYGLGTTFHADEPVTYTMYFSDASWYPMVDTWQTEGVFKAIEDLTNVHLDIISYDSNDYMQNITLEINAGSAAYIIPKIYDDSSFVDGGAIVPISQYVQYMPYFADFYNTYNMADDLRTITRADGNYYRLPGMLEEPLLNYSFMIRKDLFDAAGVDVAALEADWTWDDLCDALIQVKAYMVEQGLCSESDYIWSDLWCGNESGQGNGGNLLKVMGITYDVNAGWGIGNGMRYDPAADNFYFSPTSEAYKTFLKAANRFVAEGILDPETFTQDDSTATNKFYNGQTAIISVNQGQVANYYSNLDAQLGAGNYETYIITPPKGTTNYSTAGAERLENGVMISQNALDDLGEDGFIEMLRFVDWLFYSHEAYVLTKWGIEDETFTYTDDGSKVLMDGYCCGGLGYANDEEQSMTDIRLQWGYAGGNFWYGGTVEEMTDNYIPDVADYVNRNIEYRDTPPLSPPIVPTAEQSEDMNLIATPLIDNVNTWTLMFITGQKDIDADWDEYVASCEALNCQGLVDMYNELYTPAV
ncbi:MAG: extracellular solute-binding protein [Clostridiales bacterium]|nr:extracellular solute-binding protein [Clostridiales bacterium]